MLRVFAFKHIKKSHSTAQGRRCELCQQSFKKNVALVQHLATKYHHKCKAPKCSEKFMTPAELVIHTQSHNAAPGNPPASTSKVKATIPVVRAVHVKAVYPCPSCAQTFSKKKKLSTHMVAAHPAGPICAICRLTCPSQQVLDAHVAAVHPTCVECNERFEDDAAYAMASLS